jgi:hypothetical protein
MAGPEQGGQVEAEQVSDKLDTNIRGRIHSKHLGIIGVVSLTRGDGRLAGSPIFLAAVRMRSLSSTNT